MLQGRQELLAVFRVAPLALVRIEIGESALLESLRLGGFESARGSFDPSTIQRIAAVRKRLPGRPGAFPRLGERESV
ncbi:MAG: hypothetical protein ABL996_13400 [Micropepsaceae bacterium]